MKFQITIERSGKWQVVGTAKHVEAAAAMAYGVALAGRAGWVFVQTASSRKFSATHVGAIQRTPTGDMSCRASEFVAICRQRLAAEISRVKESHAALDWLNKRGLFQFVFGRKLGEGDSIANAAWRRRDFAAVEARAIECGVFATA